MYPLLFSLCALGVEEVIAVGGLLSGTGDPVLGLEMWLSQRVVALPGALLVFAAALRAARLPRPLTGGPGHLFPSAHPGACGGRPF